MEIVNKKTPVFTLLLCIIVFFFAASFIHAEDEQSGYQLIATEEGLRLYQTITFPAVPNTIRYIIEIEQVIDDYTVLVETIETTLNRIEVSLSAGNYRYRVTAVNRMNIFEGRSEWQDFRIILAEVPVIEGYQPFYALFFDLDDPNAVLVVHGTNFYPESEFAIIRQRPDYDWTNIELRGRNDVIFPTNVTVTDGQARLTFVRGAITKGVYEIFIRNPGGLWTVFGKVNADYSSTSNFTFSFGYSPMIAAFDYNNAFFHGYNPATGMHEENQYLSFFNPEGYNFRFGWLPLKTSIGSFGLELQIYGLYDNEVRGVNESGNLFLSSIKSVSLNLLYQFQISERWQHNVRLGFGSADDYDSYYVYANDYFLDPVMINFGASSQFFLWKNLYLEAGLDLQYVFSPARSQRLNHLMIRPSLNIGWQFGRWMDYSDVSEGMVRGEDHSVPVTQPPRTEHLFSVIWHPMIPWSGMDLYGDREDDDDNRIPMLQNVNTLAFSLYYAWLPYRWDSNKLGLGFTFGALYHINNSLIDGELQLFDLISIATLGVHYQRTMRNNWQLNAHAGIGISNPYDYNVEFQGPAFTLSYGASVQYFFTNETFVEAGLDMAWFLYDGTFRSMLRPRIAIGRQLNRDNETGLRLPTSGFPRFDFGTASILSDHYFTIGWSPVITLFGIDLSVGEVIGGVKTPGSARYLNSFNAAGFNISYAYVPLQWGRNKLGVDAELHLLDHPLRNNYSKSLISEATFGIRYQMELNDFWQINTRLAAGLSQSYDLSYYYVLPSGRSYSDSTYSFAFGVGTSVQYFFWDNMFAQAGIDITFIFADELKAVLRPGLSIGYRISRGSTNPAQ